MVELVRLPTIILGVSLIVLLISLQIGAPKLVSMVLCFLCIMVLIWETFAYLGSNSLQAKYDLSKDLPDGFAETDEEGYIIRYNEAFAKLTETVIVSGSNINDAFAHLHHKAENKEAAEQVVKTLLESPAIRFSDVLLLDDNKTYERISCSSSKSDGYRLWFIRDISHLVAESATSEHHRSLLEVDAARITEMAEQLYLAKDELEANQKELTVIANTDSLTGLCSRRYFLEQGKSFLKLRDACLSVIMLDIDFFKSVNDTYGHAAGDSVLRTFAQNIIDTIETPCIAGRLGGEEFAILCPSMTLNQATRLAEQIREKAKSTTTSYQGQSIKITCSIGVADAHMEDKTLEAALNHADKALYSAKQFGRDRVVVYEDSPAQPALIDA